MYVPVESGILSQEVATLRLPRELPDFQENPPTSKQSLAILFQIIYLPKRRKLRYLKKVSKIWIIRIDKIEIDNFRIRILL